MLPDAAVTVRLKPLAVIAETVTFTGTDEAVTEMSTEGEALNGGLNAIG